MADRKWKIEASMGESQVKRQFAVFDIDGTLIRWQLYHAIVNELAVKGYLSEDAYNKIHTSRMQWKTRTHQESFKDYEKVLIETYHAALTNLSIKNYLQVVDTIFDEYKDQVYTYTRDLITELKTSGYFLLGISGSPAEIIEKLANYYGFDDAVGNQYQRTSSTFTGEHQNVVANKDSLLNRLIEKHQLTKQGSIAVGDSESDIALLSSVEQPVAFNPSKKLFAHAEKQGWKVVIERKNMIYELEPHDGHYRLHT